MAQQTIAPRWFALYFRACAVSSLVLFGTLGVSVLGDSHYRHRPVDRFGIFAFTIGLAVFGGWLFDRLARVKFTISDTEVEVRNPFASVTIARADLLRITTTRGGSWVLVETVSGRRVPAMALSTGLKATRQARIARLNAELGLRA